MKAQIYLFITIALSILLLSCGPKVTEPSTSSSAGDTGGDGLSTAALQAIIKSGNLAGLSTNTDSLVTNTLTYLTTNANYNASTSLEARYATENGAGAKNGTNWANAWAATNLRSGINGISDASDKVYAVLVASGTYKPVTTTTTATTTQRGISFSMKNHVAIIGGFTSSGSWERTGTTTFSGDIGEGSTNDNSYQVFSHTSTPLDNGLLYGVTITGGNANGVTPSSRGGGMYNNGSSPRLVNVVFSENNAVVGGGMYNIDSSPVLTGVEFTSNSAVNGGGMYNHRSSPVLTGVEFTGNSASNHGGGMYNESSSPVLTRVEFTGNSASNHGGGVYNIGSSPVLTGVDFTGNSAGEGGGMYNDNSSPVLRGVVFSNNSSTGVSESSVSRGGGGMFNANNSSPVLVGAVFRGNSAMNNGGGMFTYFMPSGDGPVIVNSIFTANNVTTGVGKDIALDRSFSGANRNFRVAGSVLGVGEANATNGIVVTNIPRTGGTVGSYNITYHSLTNGAVDFGADRTTSTATGGLTYPTIQSSSSAKDIGLYVRRDNGINYFSDNETTWYTNFTAAGGFAGSSTSTSTLSANAEDLTATDIAGNARVGRPDAGVSEYTTP